MTFLDFREMCQSLLVCLYLLGAVAVVFVIAWAIDHVAGLL